MAVSSFLHSTRDAFLFGSACGAMFAIILFATSRRVRSLGAVTLQRGALIGATTGLAIRLALTGYGSLMALIVSGLLGAATSATSAAGC